MENTILNIILLIVDTIGRLLTIKWHISKEYGYLKSNNYWYKLFGWIFIIGSDVTMTVYSTFDPLFIWMVNGSFFVKDMWTSFLTHHSREEGARY